MSPRARRQTPTGSNTATLSPASTPPADHMVTGSPASSPESRLERISQRAYALYQRRDGQGGTAEGDWLQAEREIDSEA